MEEAQALLLKNFRVGKGTQSACAQWLTEMARDLLAPIPFREVFVILALFLPQLTFVDEATTRQELWSSPTVRKFGLVVDVTPTATGLQGMHEYRIAFPSGSQTAIFCPAHFQSCNFEQLASSPSSTVHMGSQAGKAYIESSWRSTAHATQSWRSCWLLCLPLESEKEMNRQVTNFVG